MKFYAFDFETANPDYSSICQFGLAEFTDGILTNTYVSLIDPEDYFDEYNIQIHGIEPKDVSGKPTFQLVYDKLQELTGELLIHHSAFDRVAFQRACEKYEFDLLSLDLLDTTKVVRRTWEEFRYKGYGLENMAKQLGIEYKAHDALEDSIICGQVFLAAIKQSGIKVEDWKKRILFTLSGKPYTSVATISMEGNLEGEHFGETILFTGELVISRQRAADISSQLGFQVASGISKKVDVLVVGHQELGKLKGNDKSSKHRKAIELNNKGADIRIISEKSFMSYFQDESIKQEISEKEAKKEERKKIKNEEVISGEFFSLKRSG